MELIIIIIISIHICSSFYRLEYGLCSLLAIKILIPDVARSIIPALSLNAFCSLVLTIAVLWSLINGSIKKAEINNKMVKFCLLFYILNYFFFFFSSTTPLSFQIKPMHTFYLLQLMPIMLGSIIINNKYKLILVFKVFSICFFICAVYGIIAWVSGDYWYNNLFFVHYGADFGRNTDMTTAAGAFMAGLQGRIVGTASADSYGYGMIVPIAFMIFFIFNNKLKWNITRIMVVLLAINVLMTIRRTPIITCIVFLLCMFWFEPLRVKVKYFKIGIIAFFVIAACIMFIPFLENFRNIIEASLFFWNDSVSAENEVSGSSVSLREYQLFYTLDQIKGNILFGNGWGAMYYESHPTMFGWESVVFTTLMQFGVSGVLLWTYMFWFMYKYSTRKQKNKVYQKSFIIASVALCIFTDTIYPAYIFLGCLLMGKSYLLNDADQDVGSSVINKNNN